MPTKTQAPEDPSQETPRARQLEFPTDLSEGCKSKERQGEFFARVPGLRLAGVIDLPRDEALLAQLLVNSFRCWLFSACSFMSVSVPCLRKYIFVFCSTARLQIRSEVQEVLSLVRFVSLNQAAVARCPLCEAL